MSPPAAMAVAGLATWLLVAACGGGAAEKPAPVVATAPTPSTPSTSAGAPPVSGRESTGQATDPPAHVPAVCADKSTDLCIPPGKFVDRLCIKPHQDVAFALFARGSPFTRLYLKAKVDELAFDEEVLALRFHAQPKGGMIVGSGNGTYDVLRWDGSCSTGVEAEVFTRSRPPTPRAAHVRWHRVGEHIQSALIASSDTVKRAHAKWGKECKGAITGDVSAACERAEKALADAIVAHVRSGGDLPEPEGL